jgi:hypothetical protein
MNAGEIRYGAKLFQAILVTSLNARNFTVSLYTGIYECFQLPIVGVGV